MTCDRAGTEAEEVAARIGAAFDQPFAVEGLELRIDATIGIALCPDHAEQAAELVQRAEVAVVDARKERTPFALYEPETDRFSRERLQLSTELAAPWTRTSSSSTSSRRPSWPAVAWSGSRPWSAGVTPSAGSSAPTSSSLWPSTWA